MFPPQSPVSPVSPTSGHSPVSDPSSLSREIASIARRNPDFRLDSLPKRIRRLSITATSPRFLLSPVVVKTYSGLSENRKIMQTVNLARRHEKGLMSPTECMTMIFSPRTKEQLPLCSSIASRIVSPRRPDRSVSRPNPVTLNSRKRSFEVSQQCSPKSSRDATSSCTQMGLPHSRRSKTGSSVMSERSKSLQTTRIREATTLTETQPNSQERTSKTIPQTGLQQRRRRPHPLLHSISHLRTELIPLISVVTGLPHPDFPRSLLQYHLLTHAQLDSLSRWYHQTTDAGPERDMYPSKIEYPWTTRAPRIRISHDVGADDGFVQLDLEIKRRRFGRFIGLRGCESPAIAASFAEADEPVLTRSRPAASLLLSPSIRSEQSSGSDSSNLKDEEEDITIKMERQWKAAMRQAEDEKLMAEKSWRGRF